MEVVLVGEKQQLVNQVMDRLVEAGIDFGQCELQQGEDTTSKLASVPWQMCPEGYYNPMDTVDGQLSTLEIEELKAILADKTTWDSGTSFAAVWNYWSDSSYVKDAPKLLDILGAPVLKLQHDSYLVLTRGEEFQVSKDAYGHITVGASSLPLKGALCLFGDWMEWAENYGGSAFVRGACTLIILGYICEAGQGIKVFHKVLANCPELFDEFIRGLDGECWNLGLRDGFGIASLRSFLMQTKSARESERLLSAHLSSAGRVFATLTYFDDSVQLNWETSAGSKQFVARFPKWDSALFEALSEGYPGYGEYLGFCWRMLSGALLGLAGIACASEWCFDWGMRKDEGGIAGVSAGAFDPRYICNGFEHLCSLISETSTEISPWD